MLAPAVVVAVGAVVATAHGCYEVAVASRVPEGIAPVYPVITDGLALVAYAATSRFTGAARRYAWSVVVVAAGLSGLAQATYLAGGVETAPAGLRFGVGAWPAVAAAIVAHLVYLLAVEARPAAARTPQPDAPALPAAGPVADAPRTPTTDPEIRPARTPSRAAPRTLRAVDADRSADLRAWAAELGQAPTTSAIRKRYGCRLTVAQRLLDELAEDDPAEATG